jgi:vitamin B12 transporter
MPLARSLGVLGVLSALCATADAQQRDTLLLPPVVVTATRLPTSPDRVTSSFTVITGDELRDRGITTVADALRDVPGAAVVRQGSFGGVTSLFLRGGESRYVKVLVDGVPVNQPGGAYDFSSLTTDNVERIEIVRGPASVLYGSDAVTGVVQVFTRRGGSGTHLHAGGEGGSFGTVRGSVGADGGHDRFGWSAELARHHTNGIYDFNDQYGNTVASGALRAAVGARNDVAASARFADNHSHFPTDFAGAPSDSTQLTHERSVTAGLDAGHRFGSGVAARLALASHDATGGYSTDRNAFGAVPSERSDYTLSRRSADLRTIVTPAPWATLTAGGVLELERDHRVTMDFTPGLDDTTTTPTLAPRYRHTTSGYVQALLRPAAPLDVTLGGRLDDNSAFGTFWTWRAGAAYRLGTGTRLRATVGTAFKAPSFEENFASSAFETGNPSLQPEHATTWEAGLEQTVLRGRATAAATYFDQHFRDLIQFVNAAPGEPSYRNVAGANAHGLELELAAALPADLRVSASYTWLATRVTDAGGTTDPGSVIAQGQRLIRRPAHSGRVGLRWLGIPRATIAVDVNAVGAREDIDFVEFPSVRVTLPAYATVDVAATADVVRRGPGRPSIALTLRAENLFDKHYTSVFGFRTPGRGIYAGARLGY